MKKFKEKRGVLPCLQVDSYTKKGPSTAIAELTTYWISINFLISQWHDNIEECARSRPIQPNERFIERIQRSRRIGSTQTTWKQKTRWTICQRTSKGTFTMCRIDHFLKVWSILWVLLTLLTLKSSNVWSNLQPVSYSPNIASIFVQLHLLRLGVFYERERSSNGKGVQTSR